MNNHEVTLNIFPLCRLLLNNLHQVVWVVFLQLLSSIAHELIVLAIYIYAVFDYLAGLVRILRL